MVSCFAHIIKSIGEALYLISITLYDLLKILYFNRPLKLEKMTSNDDIFVLGLGHSLRKVFDENLYRLIGKDILCVNHMVRDDSYVTLKPKYYLLLDQSIWDVLPADLDKERLVLFNEIVEKTTWPMQLMMPWRVRINKPLIQLLQRNKNIRLNFINEASCRGSKCLQDWLCLHMLATPRTLNVLISSIYVSVMMGYKTVYLLGAEHDWLRTAEIGEDNRVIVDMSHVYTDSNVRGSFGGGRTGVKGHCMENPMTMAMLLRGLGAIMREYEYLEHLSSRMGCKIYNLTEGSYIDAFQRKRIEEI